MRLSIDHIINPSGIAYYILYALLMGGLIGLLIIHGNPVFLFLAFFLSARFFLTGSSKNFLYVIIFSVFFADWLNVLGIIPDTFTWLPDMILVFLTFRVAGIIFKSRHFIRTRLDLPVILFLIWGFLSMLVNRGSPVGLFLSLRQLLKFGLYFYLLIHLNLEGSFYRKVIGLLIVLFFIQVPTALVKMVIYGQGEHAIGTYAYFGGGLSAILPVIVMAVGLGFYFFKDSNPWYLAYIAFYQLFYVACPKRMYPFFAIVIFFFLMREAGLAKWRKILPFAPVFVIVIAGLFYTSPELRSFFDNPRKIIQWSTTYTYQKDDEVTSGRVAVVELIFNTLKKNPRHLAFGFGPGTMTESFDSVEGKLRETFPIYYGWTEFATMSLEYGYVGVILFLWMVIRVFHVSREFLEEAADPFWKSIAFGYRCTVLLFIMAFFYTSIFRLDLSSFLFWFGAVIIYTIDPKEKPVEAEFAEKPALSS